MGFSLGIYPPLHDLDTLQGRAQPVGIGPDEEGRALHLPIIRLQYTAHGYATRRSQSNGVTIFCNGVVETCVWRNTNSTIIAP